MRRLALVAIVAFGLAAAGCGSSSSSPNASGSSQTTVAKPGANPSESSRMICSKEAVTDIAASLGVTAKVSTPTWADHVYSCNYVYAQGTIKLSVKELASQSAVAALYNQDAQTLGRRPDAIAFGQGAFITTNGSVIVRKDNKVLEIDVSGIPQKFGTPPQTRDNVALSIAATVMSCWTGA
ncbi:MAG TPA: hypothetical protein VH914_18225 [Acidimicrobiia bacterium]|nr:hypothetical protein [Acidimicrobiia bacterium]